MESERTALPAIDYRVDDRRKQAIILAPVIASLSGVHNLPATRSIDFFPVIYANVDMSWGKRTWNRQVDLKATKGFFAKRRGFRQTITRPTWTHTHLVMIWRGAICCTFIDFSASQYFPLPFHVSRANLLSWITQLVAVIWTSYDSSSG